MTDQSKHTPGPWKAETPRFGYQAVRQDPENWDGHGYRLICSVPQSVEGTHYGEMFRANATLIAASPDLLAALKHVRAIISEAAMTGFNWRDGDWADRLFASQAMTHAAVAKAEGTSR